MRFTEGPPGFVPLDLSKLIRKYHRHLPHWTQVGATYFVTFHLGDSLPAAKLMELEELRRDWERRLAGPNSEEAWREYSRERMRRIESWLDSGFGECHLRDEGSIRIVRNALHHFDAERYDLNAWCIMPNHVHVLVRPHEGHELQVILKSWKGFTAREINQRLVRTGPLWQQESYDTLIRDGAHLAKAIRYIGQNPGKAGISATKRRWIHPEWQRCGWGFGKVEDSSHVREEAPV